MTKDIQALAEDRYENLAAVVLLLGHGVIEIAVLHVRVKRIKFKRVPALSRFD